MKYTTFYYMSQTGDVRLNDVTYRLQYHEGAGEYRLAVLEDRVARGDDFIIRAESNRRDVTERKFLLSVILDMSVNTSADFRCRENAAVESTYLGN